PRYLAAWPSVSQSGSPTGARRCETSLRGTRATESTQSSFFLTPRAMLQGVVTVTVADSGASVMVCSTVPVCAGPGLSCSASPSAIPMAKTRTQRRPHAIQRLLGLFLRRCLRPGFTSRSVVDRASGVDVERRVLDGGQPLRPPGGGVVLGQGVLHPAVCSRAGRRALVERARL